MAAFKRYYLLLEGKRLIYAHVVSETPFSKKSGQEYLSQKFPTTTIIRHTCIKLPIKKHEHFFFKT